jgi:hypothetical protein
MWDHPQGSCFSPRGDGVASRGVFPQQTLNRLDDIESQWPLLQLDGMVGVDGVARDVTVGARGGLR